MEDSINFELYELEVYDDFIHGTTTYIKCLYDPVKGTKIDFHTNEMNFDISNDLNFNKNKFIISDDPYREGSKKFIKSVSIPKRILDYMINHEKNKNEIKNLIK